MYPETAISPTSSAGPTSLGSSPRSPAYSVLPHSEFGATVTAGEALNSIHSGGRDRASSIDKKDIDIDAHRKPYSPFDDHHAAPPPPFNLEDDSETDSPRMAHGYSHRLSTVPYQTSEPLNLPPTVAELSAGEVYAAAENLAQTLEAAAQKETNKKARKALLRRAQKIRKSNNAPDSLSGRAGDKGGSSALRNVSCGFLLLFTMPIYLTGIAVETTGTMLKGAGTMLKASGMIVKGSGTGMKNIHTMTMDNLNIKD